MQTESYTAMHRSHHLAQVEPRVGGLNEWKRCLLAKQRLKAHGDRTMGVALSYICLPSTSKQGRFSIEIVVQAEQCIV